jgi:hypothetical protein
MARHLLQPLRLDVGHAAAVQARGLHQLGATIQRPGFLLGARPGGDELDAARPRYSPAAAPALPSASILPDVAQQAGQQRLVQAS